MTTACQPGLFGVEEQPRELSAKADSLERIAALGDFTQLRLELERAVPRSGARGLCVVEGQAQFAGFTLDGGGLADGEPQDETQLIVHVAIE